MSAISYAVNSLHRERRVHHNWMLAKRASLACSSVALLITAVLAGAGLASTAVIASATATATLAALFATSRHMAAKTGQAYRDRARAISNYFERPSAPPAF